jgi:aspartyl-tRNA(Asn)/glutamyl-tRNA(Gln) amidotransferase subunit A
MQTLQELQLALTRHELSSVELTRQSLERAEQTRHLNVFLSLQPEQALSQAQASDTRRAQGQSLGPLDGIPLALKDNLCVRGVPTTCASRILEGFKPPYDATVVERLRSSGAVLIGKTNMDEFAMGSSTENSAFGPTLNPWDLERVPGGSSGGSAAAVAAGIVAGSLGSDTGGSIRQPAAFCGVTGLKPTYGRISRYGLVAYASSFDQIGPLAASAADCALLYQAIAGHDPLDSTSAPQPVVVEMDESKLRIGLVSALTTGLDPAMKAAFEAGVKHFQALGHTFVEVELPSLPHCLEAYYILATAEASSNLARYDGVRYGYRDTAGKDVAAMMRGSRSHGFGSEVKRRILLGTHVLSSGYYDAYYHQGQKARTLFRDEFDLAFTQVDAILMPTTPTPAFRIGEKTSDPLEMYLSDLYTVAANLTGLPALVVPGPQVSGSKAGPQVSGLPTGLQLMGPAWQEARLLSLGHQFQQATDYHHLNAKIEVGAKR